MPRDAAVLSQPRCGARRALRTPSGRAGARSLLTQRIRQMLHLLLLQQVPSFCERPLWHEVWCSAVLGGTSVAVQRKVVNSHILYPVNTACMLIQIIVYGADNNELIVLHFICTYHFTDLGCEVQINTQQWPYRDKRILFSYIQLLLHCTCDTEILKKWTLPIQLVAVWFMLWLFFRINTYVFFMETWPFVI